MVRREAEWFEDAESLTSESSMLHPEHASHEGRTESGSVQMGDVGWFESDLRQRTWDGEGVRKKKAIRAREKKKRKTPGDGRAWKVEVRSS